MSNFHTTVLGRCEKPGRGGIRVSACTSVLFSLSSRTSSNHHAMAASAKSECDRPTSFIAISSDGDGAAVGWPLARESVPEVISVAIAGTSCQREVRKRREMPEFSAIVRAHGATV
jgi:hypothetical protein